jgi:conjugal transfer ATP-binding protein TraC
MLSDWLPYRVYDPASRLYFNARSKGFVLSVTPLIGADERTGEILGQFFSEGLPAGACLQVLHLASRASAGSSRPGSRRGTSRAASTRRSPATGHGGSIRPRLGIGLAGRAVPRPSPPGDRLGRRAAAKAVSNEDLKQTREGLIAMLKSLNLGVAEVGRSG